SFETIRETRGQMICETTPVPAPLRNTTQTSRIEISTQRKRSSHKTLQSKAPTLNQKPGLQEIPP
ncbi:MAG: hypothetical protein OXP75_15960, partial [Rhodospirillales bacterium]|nr:hypothetical protein [Rhodospirillales bacterium]